MKNTLLEIFENILKVFDENSIEKGIFLLFLENLLLKIEPSEITSFFYTNFFRFRRGFPPFPLATSLALGECCRAIKEIEKDEMKSAMIRNLT